MKKSIFTFIILLHTNLVFGQFADNFSDGNFTANPAWSGNIGNSGNTTWDGASEEGLQLNTGMYIVWMEVFSDNGNAKRFKKAIVLSK